MSLKNIVYANSLTSAVCEQAWLSCEFEQIMIKENITFRNANINVSKKDIPLPIWCIYFCYIHIWPIQMYNNGKTTIHTQWNTHGMECPLWIILYRAQIEI